MPRSSSIGHTEENCTKEKETEDVKEVDEEKEKEKEKETEEEEVKEGNHKEEEEKEKEDKETQSEIKTKEIGATSAHNSGVVHFLREHRKGVLMTFTTVVGLSFAVAAVFFGYTSLRYIAASWRIYRARHRKIKVKRLKVQVNEDANIIHPESPSQDTTNNNNNNNKLE